MPKPASGMTSDLSLSPCSLIYRESGTISAEEARQKRLEALAARGIH